MILAASSPSSAPIALPHRRIEIEIAARALRDRIGERRRHPLLFASEPVIASNPNCPAFAMVDTPKAHGRGQRVHNWMFVTARRIGHLKRREVRYANTASARRCRLRVRNAACGVLEDT
jgi:hypothetical protein